MRCLIGYSYCHIVVQTEYGDGEESDSTSEEEDDAAEVMWMARKGVSQT